MAEINNVLKEIKLITTELIRCGMAEEYNYPVIREQEVVWNKYSDISVYLRNLDYKKIYEEIESVKNYNFRMPDGGMFQLMYRFDRRGRELQSHRLAFYPSPTYEIYQNDCELYDNDDIYGDILNKSVLPVIVRADYNKAEIKGNVHHPYSHITLGDYKNCRIPVDKPISPLKFVNFIMEHFYYVPSSSLAYNFSLKKLTEFEVHLHALDREKSRIVI